MTNDLMNESILVNACVREGERQTTLMTTR